MFFLNLSKKLAKNNFLVLKVKIIANANKTEVKEILEDDTIKLSISEKRIKQRANMALINFFKKKLKNSNIDIKIISGKNSSFKLIKIINYPY